MPVTTRHQSQIDAAHEEIALHIYKPIFNQGEAK
jgi:hypothetical protein